MSTRVKFPDNFLWGAATSAYQIEGSPLADGAGPSIWQRFSHTPGMMSNGDTGDVACDHYNRMESDVQLMKQLGLKAYRFSISWSRVLPEGRGRVNEKGLDFYSRLVDQLLANGIEPLATLYHWDLPAALDDRGGWLNPDIADWFADYATVMYKKLDGRVKKWATHNEPWVVTDGGYLHGALAPGHRSKFEAPIASHHLLRSHGKGVQAYRAEGKHQIGIVVNLEPKYPASGQRRRCGRREARRCVHESPIPRSGVLRKISGGTEGNLRRSVARMAAGRYGSDQTADRLARLQLLHAQRDEERSVELSA